ncbi:MAG TPA: phosphatase PAP2 family protein [Gemmatimonadaceae bacterium]
MPSLRTLAGVVVMLAGAATPVVAQTLDSVDSTRSSRDTSAGVVREPAPWVTRRDLFSLGAAMAATAALAPLDRPISQEFAEPRWKQSRRLHHIAGDVAFFGGDGPFVSSAVILAAGAATGSPGLRRFAVHNMEAIALATAITGIGKGITGRALPGVNTRHAFQLGRGFHEANGPFVSFPSGHTAAAFAMAATVSGELQLADSSKATMISRFAFGAAGAVGVARVVQRMHWPSDLPLAVVIGTWSGRAVQAHADQGGKVGAVLRGLTIGRSANGRTQLGWSSLAADAAR